MVEAMEAIKVTRGCGASGKSLTAGTVYTVPAHVSLADAALLVRIGKAEFVEAQPQKKRGGRDV